jgi:3-isopropylmalate dehydrogenase
MNASLDRPVRITVLPGDGIGPEVTSEAVAVLAAAGRLGGRQIRLTYARVGGDAVDHAGEPLPPETLAACSASDAALLGAVGGPAWDGLAAARRPEAGLLELRRALGLYANIRPVRCHPALADASPLRPERVAGADVVIYRELGGGIYYGKPRFTEPLADGAGERAVDTMTYTTGEVERLARLGFEAARRRRGLVTSIDKANVLDCSRLWRRTVTRLSGEYPDVRLEHAYVDSSAMDLVCRPAHFDVIVTGNMFGDILSDLAACIGGSLGMLPSASLGAGAVLYEPVHGSAPDIAGRGRANPIAAILSVAMMCELSLGWPQAAAAIRQAVDDTLAAGYRTADLAPARGGAGEVSSVKVLGTAEMGEKIRERLAEAWPEAR